jgi:hypothetical protein
MASLNTDETFWLHFHQSNTDHIEQNKPKRRMPDLGFLAKQEPGTYPNLEELLQWRGLHFFQVLRSQTKHTHHWTSRTTNLSFLYNHIEDLKEMLLHVFEDAYEGDNTAAFQLAWDIYVERYCVPLEDMVA